MALPQHRRQLRGGAAVSDARVLARPLRQAADHGPARHLQADAWAPAERAEGRRGRVRECPTISVGERLSYQKRSAVGPSSSLRSACRTAPRRAFPFHTAHPPAHTTSAPRSSGSKAGVSATPSASGTGPGPLPCQPAASPFPLPGARSRHQRAPQQRVRGGRVCHALHQWHRLILLSAQRRVYGCVDFGGQRPVAGDVGLLDPAGARAAPRPRMVDASAGVH
jgi:hypothetical protein